MTTKHQEDTQEPMTTKHQEDTQEPLTTKQLESRLAHIEWFIGRTELVEKSNGTYNAKCTHIDQRAEEFLCNFEEIEVLEDTMGSEYVERCGKVYARYKRAYENGDVY